MQVLQIQNVNFSYDEGKQFHYDFELPSNKIMALMGKSGVGKTTLLNLIAGFETTNSGVIKHAGCPLKKNSVSYLMQDAPLFDHLTAEKNISFSRADSTDINKISEKLDILGVLHKKAGDLSGGQRQRVLLAQTLLQERPIILLDEPFKGLDKYNKNRALDVIKDSARDLGRIIILVTHDPQDSTHLGAQKIYI